MFKQKGKINNIEYFTVLGYNFLYKKKGGGYVVSGIPLPTEYDYYGYLSEKIIQYGKFGKHYISWVGENAEIETPQILSSLDLNTKKGFYTSNYVYDKALKRSKSDLFAFDLSNSRNTKLLTETADILRLSYKDNLILYCPKTTLKSLSLLTGEYEWEFDVSTFPPYPFIDEEKPEEIRRLVGVWNGLLLAVLASGKLLALDMHTGRQEWQMAVPSAGYATLSQEEGKLYALERYSFVEVDLAQVRITRYRNYTQTASNPFEEAIGVPGRLKNLPDTDLGHIAVTSATYYKGRFYFTAHTEKYGGRDQNIPVDGGYTGVFNIQTEKVEWWYDLGFVGVEQGRNGDPPQVTDDKLYVLDCGGTLHIFEKEG